MDSFSAGRINAAKETGETVLAEFVPSGVTETFMPAGGVIGTLFGGIGSFLGGVFGSIIKPWKLIPAALMACIWIVLAQLQDSDETWVKVASWLTFAEGGLDRETIAGTIGGLFGKGVTAVALGSLFTGGIPKVFKGMGSLFKKGEKKSIVGAAIGIIIGAALYIAFAGLEADSGAAMAGISGALLCLEAAGNKSGWLYSMAGSLTAGSVNGRRTIRDGKAASFLAGVAAGFAGAVTYFSMR